MEKVDQTLMKVFLDKRLFEAGFAIDETVLDKVHSDNEVYTYTFKIKDDGKE